MSHVPLQPLGKNALSPVLTLTGSPPSTVTVIEPATSWMNSWVSSSQRDGPAVHSQIPADAPAASSAHSCKPAVCASVLPWPRRAHPSPRGPYVLPRRRGGGSRVWSCDGPLGKLVGV